MTTKTRVPRDEALAVAHEAIALLAPACHRLEIAGSLRRGRPEVGDIELVAVPKTHAEEADLFGERTVEVDALHDLAAQLLLAGTLAHRRDGRSRAAFGSRFKRLTFRGIALDLFAVVEPAQWGVIALLRTGPAAFSKRLVTPRQDGGCLPLGFHVKDGALWNGGERVPTPEEQDYFAALRAPWIAPEQRTDTVRLSLDTEGERTKRTASPSAGSAPKGEAPKGEAPKGEAPKGEAPKGEAPRWGWYDRPAGWGDAKTGWWAVSPPSDAEGSVESAQPEEGGRPCP